MMSENEIEFIPPEILEKAAEVSNNLLPATSKERYLEAYEKFENWRRIKNVTSLSENIFLVYFEEMSKKYKSSTLWSLYSMLKNTINLKHNVDMSKYPKLIAFLKRQAENYVPKKSSILTVENFNKFLTSAPDHIYLLIKVSEIFLHITVVVYLDPFP